MGSNTCKFLWKKKIDHGKCFKSWLLWLASIFSPGSPPSHLMAVPKSTWSFWLVLTLLFYEIIHSVWSICSCFQESVSTLGPELKSVSDSTIVLSSWSSPSSMGRTCDLLADRKCGYSVVNYVILICSSHLAGVSVFLDNSEKASCSDGEGNMAASWGTSSNVTLQETEAPITTATNNWLSSQQPCELGRGFFPCQTSDETIVPDHILFVPCKTLERIQLRPDLQELGENKYVLFLSC